MPVDVQHPTFLGLTLLAWIPLLPLLGALVNLTLGRYFTRQTVHTVAIASVVAAFGVALYLLVWYVVPAYRAGHGGEGIEQSVYTWMEVGSFKIQLAFRMDTLSAVMVMIVLAYAQRHEGCLRGRSLQTGQPCGSVGHDI